MKKKIFMVYARIFGIVFIILGFIDYLITRNLKVALAEYLIGMIFLIVFYVLKFSLHKELKNDKQHKAKKGNR